jgi:16S rRNA (adenine1518-N6/adenine1519-N6)-dimethyltransferase
MGARLGQHFLRDARVLEGILRAADVQPGHRVLEIGPGPGNLTERLSLAVGPVGKVVAVEADKSLASLLFGRWPNVEIVEGDAVQVDLAALGRFDRIVANLPYLISGPITAAFLALLDDAATRWGRAVLMYQREFALRLLASPDTSDYGRLTVHTARRCAVTKVADVPPGCFDPPPAVDSMVIRMDPHAKPPFEVRDEALFRAIVDGTFQRRRKQLRNSLPAACGGVSKDQATQALVERGWEARRPEELSPAEFAELANALAEAP